MFFCVGVYSTLTSCSPPVTSIITSTTTTKSWRSDTLIILPGWECHTGGSRSKPTVHRCSQSGRRLWVARQVHIHEPNGSAAVRQCQHGSGAWQSSSDPQPDGQSSQNSRGSVVGMTRSWSWRQTMRPWRRWSSTRLRNPWSVQTFLRVSNADQRRDNQSKVVFRAETPRQCKLEINMNKVVDDSKVLTEQWWLRWNRCRSRQMSRDKMTTTSVHLNDHTLWLQQRFRVCTTSTDAVPAVQVVNIPVVEQRQVQ